MSHNIVILVNEDWVKFLLGGLCHEVIPWTDFVNGIKLYAAFTLWEHCIINGPKLSGIKSCYISWHWKLRFFSVKYKMNIQISWMLHASTLDNRCCAEFWLPYWIWLSFMLTHGYTHNFCCSICLLFYLSCCLWKIHNYSYLHKK